MDANENNKKPPPEGLRGWLCLTINVGESIAVGNDMLIHFPINNKAKRARIAIRAIGKKIVRYRVKQESGENPH